MSDSGHRRGGFERAARRATRRRAAYYEDWIEGDAPDTDMEAALRRSHAVQEERINRRAIS